MRAPTLDTMEQVPRVWLRTCTLVTVMLAMLETYGRWKHLSTVEIDESKGCRGAQLAQAGEEGEQHWLGGRDKACSHTGQPCYQLAQHQDWLASKPSKIVCLIQLLYRSPVHGAHGKEVAWSLHQHPQEGV